MIEASDPRENFYGAQTLRQLVTINSGARSVPMGSTSKIRRGFSWRGLLIDEGRHFFGKAALFKIIDEMAAYKLNRLKLHLTDYEGWQSENPCLSQVDTKKLAGRRETPNISTTADIREIVSICRRQTHHGGCPRSKCRAMREPRPDPTPNISTPDQSAFDPSEPEDLPISFAAS